MGDLGVGFGLGFLVALQLGPMSLYLVRSTLRSGLRTGLAVGLGIAVVDALYAAVGAAGISPLLLLRPVRLVLAVVGAVVLVGLGVRALRAARTPVEGRAGATGPGPALRTSLLATAANPSTIASWAAVFAATSAPGPLLVAGVAAGSLTWGSALAAGIAAVRRSVGPRSVRVADTVAGVGLVAFGLLLGARAL